MLLLESRSTVLAVITYIILSYMNIFVLILSYIFHRLGQGSYNHVGLGR